MPNGSNILYEPELCHVCEASNVSSCSTSCSNSLRATTSPNPVCWLGPYQHTSSSCSRLITRPRASQLMHYGALARAAKDEPLLSLTIEKPLVFLGDSLAEQIFLAAQCQAARAGRSPDRIQLVKMQSFNDRRFYRSDHDRALERLGMLSLSQRRLFSTVAKRGGGIIVVCFGIHYNDAATNKLAQTSRVLEGRNQLPRTDFQDDINVLAELLANFASSCVGCHAVIVSAPSQHFPTTDGSFSPLLVPARNRTWESLGAGCTPIHSQRPTNGSSANSWRSADVLDRLARTSNITFVPWHSLTLQWWDTHVGVSETTWKGNPVQAGDHKLMLDCSHYCYTPFLYEPLWWALDLVAKS